MGNGRRPRSLHRVRRVRDGVPRREQHLDRGRRAGGARPRQALDSRRALLGRRVSRRPAQVPSGDVPALRQRAVRAGLPDLRQPSHRGRPERAGLQPLHRHALLRERLPVQRPVLRFLQPVVGQAAAPAAQSRRLAARSRRDGEVHVLRAAHQGGDDPGQGRGASARGRRDQAGLRAGVPGAGAGVRRPRRSGERGLATVAVAARQQAARGSRHEAESDVSEQRRVMQIDAPHPAVSRADQSRPASAADADVVEVLRRSWRSSARSSLAGLVGVVHADVSSASASRESGGRSSGASTSRTSSSGSASATPAR